MDVGRFYQAIADIIAAREGVTITVKEIKRKKPDETTCDDAEEHFHKGAEMLNVPA